MRTVRDVMHGDVEVLRTTESAADAACYLTAHAEDRVPLCLADGSLAGTVTDRDIVAKVVAKGLDPRHVLLAELADPDDRLALDVDAPVEEAVSVMAAAGRGPPAGDRGQPCRRAREPARRDAGTGLPGGLVRPVVRSLDGRLTHAADPPRSTDAAEPTPHQSWALDSGG